MCTCKKVEDFCGECMRGAQNAPHKHAAVIKAWADGAEIETKLPNEDSWQSCSKPVHWFGHCEYRVKPTPVPLWAIAHDTFFRHQEHLDTSRQTKWQAVADAVIKAYEERGRVL